MERLQALQEFKKRTENEIKTIGEQIDLIEKEIKEIKEKEEGKILKNAKLWFFENKLIEIKEMEGGMQRRINIMKTIQKSLEEEEKKKKQCVWKVE